MRCCGNVCKKKDSYRKLHNEELHVFYSSPNVGRVIKPKRIR
jgi:hypothetical protein